LNAPKSIHSSQPSLQSVNDNTTRPAVLLIVFWYDFDFYSGTRTSTGYELLNFGGVEVMSNSASVAPISAVVEVAIYISTRSNENSALSFDFVEQQPIKQEVVECIEGALSRAKNEFQHDRLPTVAVTPRCLPQQSPRCPVDTKSHHDDASMLRSCDGCL
jgi:hypothetical protein